MAAPIARAALPFDPAQFTKTIALTALRIPNMLTATLISRLKPRNVLFHHTKFRPVIDDTDSKATKLILLSPAITNIASVSELPQPIVEALGDNASSVEIVSHSVTEQYRDLSMDAIFSQLLPSGVHGPSSFECVGHIAHVNLTDSLLPYASLIGAVILSHTPNIRTVVNKTSAISDEFRVFPMTVIAGDTDTNASVRENGCVFELDYRTVYWNSRLGTEHARVVECVKDGAVVLDMMAGIGPFIIPIAKKLRETRLSARRAKQRTKSTTATTINTGTSANVRLFANDKNPSSVAWLRKNLSLNGVSDEVEVFNHDARDFIATVHARLSEGNIDRVDHIVMNLPAIAIEFLDALDGLYADDDSGSRPLPFVHVYCFASANAELAEREIRQRVETTMKCPLQPITHSHNATADTNTNVKGKRKHNVIPSMVLDERRALLHLVRNVAPNKDMYCLSFQLQREVAQRQGTADGSAVSSSSSSSLSVSRVLLTR